MKLFFPSEGACFVEADNLMHIIYFENHQDFCGVVCHFAIYDIVVSLHNHLVRKVFNDFCVWPELFCQSVFGVGIEFEVVVSDPVGIIHMFLFVGLMHVLGLLFNVFVSEVEFFKQVLICGLPCSCMVVVVFVILEVKKTANRRVMSRKLLFIILFDGTIPAVVDNFCLD